jgi:ferredoxin-NADP reductase
MGNVFSYLVSPKQKIWFSLKQVHKLTKEIYHFEFESPSKLQFKAGQYLEWTLPHAQPDQRGNRRYFTVASSPTESEVALGVRILPETASSFKKGMLALKPGDEMVGTQVSGNFILPSDAHEKLVLIAGGIGITPFRSMIKYLHDTKQKGDITLIYVCHDPAEFVYQDVFAAARTSVGLKTIYVLSRAENAPPKWQGLVGHLTSEMIVQTVSDYQDRTYYLSGPDGMVRACQAVLTSMNISRNKVKTDYFSGY